MSTYTGEQHVTVSAVVIVKELLLLTEYKQASVDVVRLHEV